MSSLQSTRAPSGEAVLVCGLGRLGIQCVRALEGYRVPVRAIDLRRPAELEQTHALITTGDFRDPATLRRAGIEECRSIVLLSSDNAANIEGALAARRANPRVRLVVRGEQERWHELLSQELGNLVVYEPNRLSAPAFAFAVLDSHVLAHFYVDDQLFQVTEHIVEKGDPWIAAPVEAAHGPGRQILLYVPAPIDPTKPAGIDSQPPKEHRERKDHKARDHKEHRDHGLHREHRRESSEPPEQAARRDLDFYGWRPEQKIGIGDRLLILSTGQPLAEYTAEPRHRPGWLASLSWLLHKLNQRRQAGFTRPTLVSLTAAAVLGSLLLWAIAFFSFGQLNLPLHESLRLSVMLLTGGHLADVFLDYASLPPSAKWAEVLLTIMGTILTAVLYALLTDQLLTARFQLLSRRPRPPLRDHVIVAGLGAIGESISSFLQKLERPVVAVEPDPPDIHTLPRLPVVRGSATNPETLHEVNIDGAHGLVASTADDLQNVQIALLAASLNPSCRIAVRVYDPRLSGNASFLLPNARVLCVSALAATAYAAAALGEHVVSLFQLLHRPALVVEYDVASGDTLEQRALWEIAEGYSVVPVLYQPQGSPARVPNADDAAAHLLPGDRLVVLASATSLEAIERGDLRPREYELWLERLRPYAEPLQLVGLFTQRLGYTLEQALDVLGNLPQRVPQRFYGLYATRTHRLLTLNGVQTSLRRAEDAAVELTPRESLHV